MAFSALSSSLLESVMKRHIPELHCLLSVACLTMAAVEFEKALRVDEKREVPWSSASDLKREEQIWPHGECHPPFPNPLSTCWTPLNRDTPPASALVNNPKKKNSADRGKCEEKGSAKQSHLSYGSAMVCIQWFLHLKCWKLLCAIVLDCKTNLVSTALLEHGPYCKLYRMSDELEVTCITVTRCYLMLCTAGSEQSDSVTG